MPKDFENCIKNGGKVRTKTLSGGRYQKFCMLNGKNFAGEIKKSVSSSVSKKIKSMRKA